MSTDGKLEASLALHGTSAASMARAAWSQQLSRAEGCTTRCINAPEMQKWSTLRNSWILDDFRALYFKLFRCSLQQWFYGERETGELSV